MLTGKRLLIVEAEALIALDIQRICEDGGAARVEIARDYQDLLALQARLAEDYDMIILTPPPTRPAEAELFQRLCATRLGLVVCSADRALTFCPKTGVEVVVKPFSDEDLLAACQAAVARQEQTC